MLLGKEDTEVTLEGTQFTRFTVYLLYCYKSTYTDAKGAARL